MPSLQLNWGPVLLWLLGAIALSVGGIVGVSALLIRLPATHFSECRSGTFWKDAHPVLRWIALILKNTLGAVLVAFGIVLAMPAVPGPGILTILLGVTLMDIPGKRRLERWLVGRPRIIGAVNRLRHRHGKPPFVLNSNGPVGQGSRDGGPTQTRGA